MACANLASLLVARGRSREHLAAINAALGASRTRLLTGALLESAIVCLAGAAVGVAAVAATSKGLLQVLPPLFSRYASGVADPRVVLFAICAAMLSALVAGLVPAWRATRVDVLAILQKGTRSGQRTRVRGGRGLIAAEAALGALLVLGSVLALRSFIVLASDRLGFEPRDLYVVSVNGAGKSTMDEQRTRIEQALEVVRLVPGVAAAAASDNVPASGEAPVRGFAKDQKAGVRVQVSANYFETMGATLLAGRTFTPEDIASRANVAMVSRLGVELLWPGLTPHQVLGRLWQPADETPREIIGVVDEMKNSYGLDRGRPTAYVALGAEPTPWRSIVVRAQPGAALQVESIRARVQERLGREIHVSMSSLWESMDRNLRDPRFLAVLMTTLALTGLLLAIVGLYAVTNYDVSLRRYEMGVRVVMGATAADLKRLVRREALVPVLMGAAVGLIAAYWLAQFAQGLLFRTDGRDPWLYLIVAGVLVATALVASWLPARRVAATDPATVLRAQ
jgi:predicted permease